MDVIYHSNTLRSECEAINVHTWTCGPHYDFRNYLFHKFIRSSNKKTENNLRKVISGSTLCVYQENKNKNVIILSHVMYKVQCDLSGVNKTS